MAPLIVRSVAFLGGMAQAGGWRPESRLPEVAFSGRSNVGKSSLINTLLRRRRIARVSNTPGRTREINFFAVNDGFVLADLPGYGYARVSRARRAEWRPLIEGFLKGSPTLRGVVQLLDARREPTSDDLQMLEFLAGRGTPAIVVATKVDKLRRAERAARLADLANAAGLAPEDVLPFSAVTGEGRDELAEAILDLIDRDVQRGTRDERL